MTESKIKRQFIKTYYIKDKNTPDKMDKIFFLEYFFIFQLNKTHLSSIISNS